MKSTPSGSVGCQALNCRVVKRFKGRLKKGLSEEERTLTKTWNFSAPLLNPV